MKSGSTPSANHVDSNPTLKELQLTMPDLTEDQYIHILVALNHKPVAPRGNATFASIFEFASGLLPVAPNRWIIDSGKTHHITFSSKLLMDIDESAFFFTQR